MIIRAEQLDVQAPPHTSLSRVREGSRDRDVGVGNQEQISLVIFLSRVNVLILALSIIIRDLGLIIVVSCCRRLG